VRFIGALLLVVASASSAGAWGFPGHRLVNAQATHTLPPPLAALFAANEAWISEHAIDPDLWVLSGREGELPNHFMNLDAFGAYPFADIPLLEADHLARFGEKAVEQGRVPWRVADVYRDLVSAFAAQDEARVLERAAVLGHYVADAHVPLHAIVNYDGQLTGQKGVHARWESELVARFERQIESRVEPSAAVRIDDPAAFVFDVLRESFVRSPDALVADRETAGPRDYADTPEDDRYDDGYYSRFYEREGDTVVARLDAAATALGSLWLSAWEDAGRPTLDEGFRFPYVRGETRLVLLRIPVTFDDALGRGQLPQLSRLRQRGSVGRVDQIPTTGSDPLFLAAARQGIPAATLLVSEAQPFTPFLEGKRYGANYGRYLTLLDAEDVMRVSSAVWTEKDTAFRDPQGWTGEVPEGAQEFEVRTDDEPLFGLVFDDPDDSTRGMDTVLLATSRDVDAAVKLKPRVAGTGGDAFASLTVPTAAGRVDVSFRLYALGTDGKSFLLHQTGVRGFVASRQRVGGAAGILAEASDEAYLRGDFGPLLWNGGDGTAEGRYVETVANAVQSFARVLAFGLEKTRWEILMADVPPPGPAIAEWRKRIDAGKDGGVARRLRRFHDQYLVSLDGVVGDLARQIDDETAVALFTPSSFVLAGPGVTAEKNLGPVSPAAVPSTLAMLLGLETATSDPPPLRAALSRLPPPAPARGKKKTQDVGDPTRPPVSRPAKAADDGGYNQARLLQRRSPVNRP
jgi:hypothetical protein